MSYDLLTCGEKGVCRSQKQLLTAAAVCLLRMHACTVQVEYAFQIYTYMNNKWDPEPVISFLAATEILTFV